MRQHRAHPDAKMTPDIMRYKPFKQYFRIHRLAEARNDWGAEVLESHYILRFEAIKHGYNTFPGKPTNTNRFWYLRRQGVLQYLDNGLAVHSVVQHRSSGLPIGLKCSWIFQWCNTNNLLASLCLHCKRISMWRGPNSFAMPVLQMYVRMSPDDR